MSSNKYNLSDEQLRMAAKMGLTPEQYFAGICRGLPQGDAAQTKAKIGRAFEHSHLIGNEREMLRKLYKGETDNGK